MTKRIGLKIFIAIVLLVVGFVYMIKSCLSKYDERMAIGGGGSSSQAASQFLVFEKRGKGVIFSMVQFDKTTSYSRKGGSTHRSVRRTYYAQSNDLGTAEKINTQKIKSGSSIKSYPVELLGAGGDKAWLFAGELMAYDPYTLNKLADAAILEEKNPSLKGKLINERKYYEFDNDSKQIHLTTADGSKYELNTNTLLVTPVSDEKPKSELETSFLELDKRIKVLRTANAKAYDRLRAHNQQYQQKTMPLQQYKDSSEAIRKEVALLDKERDSLEKINYVIAKKLRSGEDDKNRKNNARRMGSGFSSMKLSNDTLEQRWYGLYTTDQLEKESDRFDHRTTYDEAARAKLFSADITSKDDNWIVGEEKTTLGNAVFLQGGFLIDKTTGLPFHLGYDFLVVYKDRIGNEGMVQLARISRDGKQVWTLNTGLKEFYDWQSKGDKLIIAGTDNKELSSSEINLMQIVNLQNGSVVAYDFFKDKIRTSLKEVAE